MGTYREQHVYQQHGEQVNHYLHLIVHTEMSRRLQFERNIIFISLYEKKIADLFKTS
jgi:hypothetical protein